MRGTEIGPDGKVVKMYKHQDHVAGWSPMPYRGPNPSCSTDTLVDDSDEEDAISEVSHLSSPKKRRSVLSEAAALGKETLGRLLPRKKNRRETGGVVTLLE